MCEIYTINCFLPLDSLNNNFSSFVSAQTELGWRLKSGEALQLQHSLVFLASRISYPQPQNIPFIIKNNNKVWIGYITLKIKRSITLHWGQERDVGVCSKEQSAC